MMHNTGGLSFDGYRDFDLTTILRVLDCPAARYAQINVSDCTTLVVDEHRYEGCMFISNVASWFHLVLWLRAIGQGYILLRLLCLLVGCYVARKSEEQYHGQGFAKTFRAALSTMAKMPCQCIVYGTPFPAACYLAAHIIDAPFTYRVAHERFTVVVGQEPDFTLTDLIKFSAVLTRNVWLQACTIHVIMWWATSRRWDPPNGIYGVPEYVLTILSGLSTFAYMRSRKYRNTDVSEISEISSDLRHVAMIRPTHNTHAVGSVSMEGVWTDVKSLVFLLLVAWALTFLWSAVLSIRRGELVSRVGLMIANTPVPYSAGLLWNPAAFSVYWPIQTFPSGPVSTPRDATQMLQWITRVLTFQQPSSNKLLQRGNSAASKRALLAKEWPVDLKARLYFARDQLRNIHERCDNAHAVVAFMNLYAMTDPWTLLRLKWGSGVDICILRYRPTGQLCCLPLDLHDRELITSIPWELMDKIALVNSKEMVWSDLLHCG